MSTLLVGGRGAIGSAVAARLKKGGERVDVLDISDGIDASNEDQVTNFIDGLPSPPKNLVHVAGTVGSGGILDVSLEDWNHELQNNLSSVFVVARATLPGMLAHGGGSIALTSSINGRHGGNELSGPAYAAAKAGVISLSRSIAKEFGSRGVRCNALAPGPVRSSMTDRLSSDQLLNLTRACPLGRMARAEEVADVIVFLIGEGASYINGATIDVNGGGWMG